ncbi:MAG: phage holin family protein [Methanobrevibacter thaueri]|uniref:Phage holin family protein n=1 Tax=Methanobrevibacter thaueri TaxID=190975 RepID=A0A8T3VH79_9EURY|nr:phage holin family protein [Methanobrevibacter thaueri]MBE6502018.1 phage holin family protein [Methanobrevibacter thaueri]
MEYVKKFETPPRTTLKRSIIIFIGNVLGIYLISFFGLGVKISYFDDIAFLVIFISIINALLWPLLTRIFMPFLVFTFGFGSLILNGILLELFAPMFDIEITGLAIILAPLAMAFVTTFLSSLLTIEDDASYYRSVFRDAKKKRKGKVKEYPGLIIVEIDGLAYDVLREALDKDLMPTVKSLIEDKTHTLRKWETDLSSQTGASQAGILHGNNTDITAFRWIEKANNNEMMQCSGVSKVKILEERISDGNGLLVDDGASRSNLFSGDTDNVIFTFSKILNIKKLYNKAWYSVFSNPSNFARILSLFIAEMILEIISQIKHSVMNIKPRIKRGIAYIVVRAATNVFMREINTSTLVGDMLIGDVDVAYSTYLGYDEIAHHSGVRDEDSWFALKGMDKQIRHLVNATKYTPRDYQFVIQSDHGQTNGATFMQRYGESFEDFVKSLLPKDMKMFAKMSSNEDHYAESFIPFTKNNDDRIDEKEMEELGDSEVIVLASGNLAMIYLTQWSHRLTYEEINEFLPELIPGIINNEYIGFIVVKSSEHGNLAIGKNGTYYLDSDKIEGENPLEGFGENIARHIKRNVSFQYTPDILVNSFYDAENDEVCAFEELVGSHGGAGGSQSEPFILYPSDWDIGSDEILGAENIYKILKSNLKNLKEGAADDK